MAEIKEVNRHAKQGEYIKIVNASESCGCYEDGDIYQVIYASDIFLGDVRVETGIPMFPEDGKTFARVNTNEYVVLEGYEPPIKEAPCKIN